MKGGGRHAGAWRASFKRWARGVGAYLAALLLLLWRRTCRYRIENDPRPALRARGQGYVYALLHAHQLAAVFANDEPRLAAMVSRSGDGDLLVPALRLRRVRAVRGSTRKGATDKGGRTALAILAGLLRRTIPVLLAIDGPRGPRGRVQRGVADLARDTGAPILPTLVLPSRRWFLGRTWDRFQIPQPFTLVRLIFGDPIEATPNETAEALCRRLEAALGELEARYDPQEGRGARAAGPPLPRRSAT